MKEYLYEIAITKLAERSTNERLSNSDSALAAQYTHAKSIKRAVKRHSSIGSKMYGAVGAVTGGALGAMNARAAGHSKLRSAGHGLLGAIAGGGAGAATGGAVGALTGTASSLAGKGVRKIHKKLSPADSAFMDKLVSEGKAPNRSIRNRMLQAGMYTKEEREKGMKAHGYKSK